MRSAAFAGRQMKVQQCDDFGNITSICIPTLSAYAIEHSEFTLPPHTDLGFHVLCQGPDFSVTGDEISFRCPFQAQLGIESCRMVIHYHGIRDYELLFPQIIDPALRRRLSYYLEEAELAFDSGAWLSFSLMAGAVYEGLLSWRLRVSHGSFYDMICDSVEQGLISDTDATTLQEAREVRNLVHPLKATDEWVSRLKAFDMMSVMQDLMKRLSLESPNDC